MAGVKVRHFVWLAILNQIQIHVQLADEIEANQKGLGVLKMSHTSYCLTYSFFVWWSKTIFIYI